MQCVNTFRASALIATLWFSAAAQAGTLLSLPFNGTLVGADGETPITATGISFTAGIGGQAADFSPDDLLTYSSSNNINAQFGTLDFVVRPKWNGNDNLNHGFLDWGGGGGATFGKDAANNLRGVFNRFGSSSGPELGMPGWNVSDWVAGERHYLAYTWDNSAKELKLYLDGVLKTSTTYTGDLPLISAAVMQIGGQDGLGTLDGTLDEFRIGDTALSSEIIAQRFAALVPEPHSLLLTGSALVLACFAAFARRRTRHK